jgi:CRP-like cAMP-binding protein
LDFSLLLKAGLPRRSFVADEAIFREGDKAEALFVIESGRVEIQAGRRVLAILGPGEFLAKCRCSTPRRAAPPPSR